MKCASCGSEDFQRPEAPQALERWQCLTCGVEVFVHCNYVPTAEELAMFPKQDRFQGAITFESNDTRLKTFLKLKHSLEFAERFSVAALEAQHLSGSLHWDLGEFFDFEIERVESECKKAGVSPKFSKLLD